LAVTIKLGPRTPERRTVPVDGLDGCALVVREPTVDEMFNQWIESSGQRLPNGSFPTDAGKLFAYRLRVIEDWSGFVNEAGDVLQFNHVTFGKAITQSETLMWAAAGIVRDAFQGLEAQDEKNSDTPPSDGSPAAALTTGG